MQIVTGGGCGGGDGRVVTVGEIRVSAGVEALQEASGAQLLKRVPAHVRDAGVADEAFYFAAENAKTGFARRFFAAVKEALQTDADAEERNTGGDFFSEGLAETEPVNGLHHLAKVANAGEDEFGSAENDGRLICDFVLGAQFSESVFD